MTIRLSNLILPGSPSAWDAVVPEPLRSLDGALRLAPTGLRWLDPPLERLSWEFESSDEGSDLDCDGVPVRVVEPEVNHAEPGSTPAHGASIDHVVVVTDSIERTSGAVEHLTGEGLRRIRDTGQVRQGFHRLGRGGTILELVERPGAPTSLWGFVLTVPDLDAVVTNARGLIAPARDAVQPGRRIATVERAAGLGTAVAFMSPEPLD